MKIDISWNQLFDCYPFNTYLLMVVAYNYDYKNVLIRFECHLITKNLKIKFFKNKTSVQLDKYITITFLIVLLYLIIFF